jgi:hypothetical protein
MGNNMDRLLSEQEMYDIPPTGFDVEAEITDEDICKAQDAKTAAAVNTEWAEWCESYLTHEQFFAGHPERWAAWKKRKGNVGL